MWNSQKNFAVYCSHLAFLNCNNLVHPDDTTTQAFQNSLDVHFFLTQVYLHYSASCIYKNLITWR